MLETIHLTKIYKTKGGADVRALDDVSIQFPETGMVFLLGKSGSGKSTLLNVCGGLDSPTLGAISVKGRTSTAFTQSDFDSYRNTFVGFIFQEYNILNEFTVEDNIALALELQGKPKDKKRIAEILEQVDLAGYGKRKPNTLSGGQKQRIAIARALVKSPEIIMADEPTGALDSETGKQVFDTLKKLSKDKLVIVVSHDRDFAETYGDRIIELKDGKVISDVTKTHEESQDINHNISVVGDTLCVRKGAELTEEDFAEIKEFLSKAQSDVIIATGEQEVKEFKETNHIREDGVEVFRNSEEIPVEKKNYSPEESRFIRSKLPAKHAFKIGVSSLKTKPIRLAFTVLLCTVAFIFFGMLSTMTFYDNEATFKQSLKDSNYTMVQLGKYYQTTEIWYYQGEKQDEYTSIGTTKYTKEELKAYAEKFGKEAFGATSVYMGLNVQNRTGRYWVPQLYSIGYLELDNPLREKITGQYPTKPNEICISSYLADVIYNCKMYDETGNLLTLNKAEDVIGKKISLQGEYYTVVGILDSGVISEKYDVLKDPENTDYMLYSGLNNELQDGLHLVGFVSEDLYEKLAGEFDYSYVMTEFDHHEIATALGFGIGSNYVYPDWCNGGYAGYSKYATDGTFIPLMDGKTTPAENEAYINASALCGLIIEMAEREGSGVSSELLELANTLAMGGIQTENEETGEYDWREFNATERENYIKQIVELIKKEGKTLTISMKLYDSYDGGFLGEPVECTVIGIWNDGRNKGGRVLLADTKAQDLWDVQKSTVSGYYESYTSYVEPEDAIYQTIYVPYDHSETQTNQLWDIYAAKEYDEEDVRHTLTSQLIMNLEVVDELVNALSKVFLYAGLVLAIFAALLLSNFTAISISYKKREIGILRAVGARSIDVFKIFFSESFVITAVCLVISIIGSVAVCSAINGILVDLIDASLFVFGPLSWIVLLAIAFVTAVVATFIPVWNAAKKKPVESIRAL